jgi:hypothetical protein
MIGNRLEVGFGSFGRLAMGNAKGKMDNIASGGVPISGCHLFQRLVGLLVHFPQGLEEYGAVFCAMVGCTVVEHAIRRSERIWASTTATAAI